MKLGSVSPNGVQDMTSVGMTSHCMTSRYGVHFCVDCVNRAALQTCKVSIRYVSWFTRYLTTLIIFRMTLVLRCMHHFNSDLIYNMDHMRIMGTEPSSVILSQRKQLKSDSPKVPNQANTKRDGVINPQNYNFSQFKHG